jgi:hypothetical protein
MNQTADRQLFDRRLFRAVAIAFPVIVFAGFGRTYYVKGLFDVPPLASMLVHVHGLLMTAWVVLFATQVWLVSAKRIRLHQRLGYAGIGLGSLIVVVGFVTAVRAARYGAASAPPDVSPLAFLAVPLFDLVMFVALFGAAICYRRRPAAHKRLMLLTAVNFLPPAIARVPITTLQALGPLWFFGLPASLTLLCLGLDARRNGHVSRVFLAGTVLLVSSYVGRLALMTTGTWMTLAGWLVTFV